MAPERLIALERSMPRYSRLDALEVRSVDLEQVIERFKVNRADMLRLRRGATAEIKSILDERLAVNTRTIRTLTTTLAAVRAELRRYKALNTEWNSVPLGRTGIGNLGNAVGKRPPPAEGKRLAKQKHA